MKKRRQIVKKKYYKNCYTVYISVTILVNVHYSTLQYYLVIS